MYSEEGGINNARKQKCMTEITGPNGVLVQAVIITRSHQVLCNIIKKVNIDYSKTMIDKIRLKADFKLLIFKKKGFLNKEKEEKGKSIC